MKPIHVAFSWASFAGGLAAVATGLANVAPANSQAAQIAAGLLMILGALGVSIGKSK